LKAFDKPAAITIPKDPIESRLHKSDLDDVLIVVDNRTNFLRHFLPPGMDSVANRLDALTALLATVCNIGCQRMALASGLNFHEIASLQTNTKLKMGLKLPASTLSLLPRESL
jgi:hypothetical protein